MTALFSDDLVCTFTDAVATPLPTKVVAPGETCLDEPPADDFPEDEPDVDRPNTIPLTHP